MNKNTTAPAKTAPAKPSGRRYGSVTELLRKEKASEQVQAEFSTLNAQTVVVRRLVSLRVAAGMTQTDLAKKIGCTQSRISKIEASRDDDLTLGVIRDYVKATGSRIGLFCGKPLSHVEAVKNHALGIRSHLESLAKIARKDDELEPLIQKFFGEAFFNILTILAECQDQMPAGNKAFELQVTCPEEKPVNSSPAQSLDVCCA